jgi:predicted enzyme related to lactoylglutathione lyase
MRWRGVSHVELAVRDYDDSITFYDSLFGWLGYDSFSSLNMEYHHLLHDALWQPAQLHWYPTRPNRGQADA